MDFEKLTALIEQIDASNLAYMNYETESEHIILAKEVPHMSGHQDVAQAVQSAPATMAENIVETPVTPAAQEAEVTVPAEKEGEVVESPMVGVVYLQPQPDEDPYVKVGDRVEQGDVICIIEAMKLMNEIQAPYAGVVTEILVNDEEVVEFNQPIVRIEV